MSRQHSNTTRATTMKVPEYVIPAYLRNLYEAARKLPVGVSEDGFFSILVTGSRDYDNLLIPTAVLSGLTAGMAAVHVTHGAARGLDSIARDIARVNADRGWSEEGFPANWKMFRDSAGPLRNARMLEGRTYQVCVGFPLFASVGTWDMLTRAHQAGTPSYVVSHGAIRPMTDRDCVPLYPFRRV